MPGPVVHLVERFICNEEVCGSSPHGSTTVCIPPWREGDRFEPDTVHQMKPSEFSLQLSVKILRTES